VNITCPHCNTKLNIPDHKIPKDKDSSFKCPKCGDRVQVTASQITASDQGDRENGTAGQASMGSAPLSARGREQALVCMADSPGRIKLVAAAKDAGFHVETPASISEALGRMEYQLYSLVLVDDVFDRNQGFKAMSVHMNEMDMSLRRRICLILISDFFSTGDPMAALHSSVNYIIGSNDLDHPEGVLSTALTEHLNFYTVFNDSMRAAGKA